MWTKSQFQMRLSHVGSSISYCTVVIPRGMLDRVSTDGRPTSLQHLQIGLDTVEIHRHYLGNKLRTAGVNACRIASSP